MPLTAVLRPSVRLPSLFCVVTLLSVLLPGCAKGPTPPVEPPVRPVKVFKVGDDHSTSIRSFPGKVDASLRAELAFRIAGSVQRIFVKEGDLVKKGQLLVSLDPADFEITVADRKATAENAASNFQRAKELIVDGNISKTDYDRMEANMKTSAAALQQAEQSLAYTQLKAPFAGRIAKTYIKNFEEINAKQQILRLQNEDELEVKISVPESIVRNLRRGISRDARDLVTAYAEFDGRVDKHFPLIIKELTAKADSQTQTFEVTFAMSAPTEFTVLPGMTTAVTVDLSAVSNLSSVHWVPVRAVVAESELNALVWVLDAESMTVSSRRVEIGRMSGASIEIKKGLSGGEEIIGVGASYLAEGMRVSRMIQTEQAELRVDDPV